MADYKNKIISFREFENAVNTIVNDSFVDDVYSAARYELSKRTVTLQLYAPDFDISDITAVWSETANKILKQLKENRQHKALMQAAENQITHKLRGIECSSFSATDITLAKFLTVLRERLESEDKLDMQIIDRFISAVETTEKPEFKNNIAIALGRDNSEDSKKS